MGGTLYHCADFGALLLPTYIQWGMDMMAQPICPLFINTMELPGLMFLLNCQMAGAMGTYLPCGVLVLIIFTQVVMQTMVRKMFRYSIILMEPVGHTCLWKRLTVGAT